MGTLHRGDRLPLPSGELTVLWPVAGAVRSGQNANNSCLVTRLTLKGNTMLLPSDLPGAYEGYVGIPADVVKIPHHGAVGSMTQGFVEGVAPSMAVLSSNRKGFPAQRLGADVPVYATADGGITLFFEEDGFRVSQGFPFP